MNLSVAEANELDAAARTPGYLEPGSPSNVCLVCLVCRAPRHACSPQSAGTAYMLVPWQPQDWTSTVASLNDWASCLKSAQSYL
eukprot:1142073-Pelagomonas_calceolata.AAC.3